jgi:methylthioribose-1-phosphate isomerase
MNIDGHHYRTIWLADDGWSVEIIDQTRLPFAFEVVRLATVDEAIEAIRVMRVRGAPLIGATAAYGLCLALREDAGDEALDRAAERLVAARPTAINLRWAVAEIREAVEPHVGEARVHAAYRRAAEICDDDVETCRRIGGHGLELLRALAEQRPASKVNVLTHCNAGWLATVDWGTALAPIYRAHEEGIAVHVWVDETRPRSQGSLLTAWELGAHGIDHTVIVDNAGGHLMQHGEVDVCIVGTDRTTAGGDVANKVGTYLKALAAHDNGVPFYVALPHSTIDWSLDDGVQGIPIEMRDPEEVTTMIGLDAHGDATRFEVVAPGSLAVNYAFDVTPRRLVTGLITERGVCPASADGLRGLYPERAS